MYLFAILSTTSKINARTDAQDAPPGCPKSAFGKSLRVLYYR